MLDLDSLAEKRATLLNEQKDRWHKAVWSPGFQQISANMSDGEVEILLASCKSFSHLEAVVSFLTENSAVEIPFGTISQRAKSAGLALSDWIATLPRTSK